MEIWFINRTIRFWNVLAIGLVAFGLTGCRHLPDGGGEKGPRRWHAMNEKFMLSRDEFKRLKREAGNGSIEACERLSWYYQFVRLDDKEAAEWEFEAGRLGSPEGFANGKELLEFHRRKKTGE